MTVEDTMVINEKDYYLGIWYLEIPTCEMSILGGNVTATAYRKEGQPATDWKLELRFRWYRDEVAHESSDKKTFYNFEMKNCTELTMIKSVEQTLERAVSMASSSGAMPMVKPVFYSLRCHGKEAMDRIINSPPDFLHFRMVDTKGKSIEQIQKESGGTLPASAIQRFKDLGHPDK